MTATMATPNLAEQEQRLVLIGVGWGQYVTISDALPDWRGLRMIYLDGRLTFLTTSWHHDWLSKRLSQLVVAVADGGGIVWEDAGQATFRREDFGENAERR